MAVFALGIVEAGVGVAQYYRPSLGTTIHGIDATVAKTIAFHDAVVGVAALIVGLILGTAGVLRSRALARADIRGSKEAERTARISNRPAERVIDLDAKPGLEPMPATPESDVAPIAQRVWQCRLAVDLQQQRIMKEAIGAESKIDAELYVLALRNLVQATKEAQSRTRSLAIWEAMTRFAQTADNADMFMTELGHVGSSAETTIDVDFGPAGTIVHIGRFELPAARLTAAADQLANATIGDLSNVRERTVQKTHVSARTHDQ